ncbi:aminomethyltransferase [Nitrospira sp.]|nr:aminomethyltransferase [Nitrospira sp.]
MARTPLYDAHLAFGGRIVDFAGWDMPIQYSGVVDEYQAVRNQAGLFDVSHMGRMSVTGPRAAELLNHLTTNDVTKLDVGQAQYSMVCNEDGGIKDDIFVYRTRLDGYLVCMNASNRRKIVQWFGSQAQSLPDCDMRDRSDELAQLALQGPVSRTVLHSMGMREVDALQVRHCVEVTLAGAACLLARTGYTGELGYELYLPAEHARMLWDQCLERGASQGVKPAGLGARDILRLEMAYLLYGNDISEDTSPLEADAAWAVAFDKPAFIGRTALLAQHANLSRKLVAFELLERGVPRHGFAICTPDPGRERIGEVTSGNLSPILQKGIGMGYVPPGFASPGSSLVIDIRGKAIPAAVVKPPFYRHKRSV